MNRSEREALLDGLTEIDRLVDALDLDASVKQRSTDIYRQAATADDILSGRGIDSVVAGCVLLATRESADVREASDVAEHTADRIQTKTIHRTTKKLRNELDLGFLLADPHKYVEQIQADLGASDELADRSHDAIDIVVEDGIASGKKASAIAAACFYVVGVFNADNGSHGKYTQSQISDAAGVSEVTIRNSYRDFGEVLSDSPEMSFRIKQTS